MLSIFTLPNYTRVPATIIYDDDDQLIEAVLNLGAKGTYTFKTDGNPSGEPPASFRGQIILEELESMAEGAETQYQLRKGAIKSSRTK